MANRGTHFSWSLEVFRLEALYTMGIRIKGKIGKSRLATTSKAPSLLGLLKEKRAGFQGKNERTQISPQHSERVEYQTPLA